MKIKSFANSTIVYRGRGKKLVITPLSVVEVDETTFPVASLMATYGKWLRVVKDGVKVEPKVEEVKVEETKVEEQPVVEETKVEEVKTEEQPVVEETKVEETKTEEQPVVEDDCKECVVPTVEEQPVVEEVKAETKKAKATKSKKNK